jgi:hypothetical protein
MTLNINLKVVNVMQTHILLPDPFHWKLHMLQYLACICSEIEQVPSYKNNFILHENIDLKYDPEIRAPDKLF